MSYGPCQYKGCLLTYAKQTDSDSSHACANTDTDLCSSLIHSIVSYNSVSGQRRPWSDCANAQADLGLCCPHLPEDLAHMRTAKAHMNLCPYAHWSGPSLAVDIFFSNHLFGEFICGQWICWLKRANAQADLGLCDRICVTALFVLCGIYNYVHTGLDVIFATC